MRRLLLLWLTLVCPVFAQSITVVPATAPGVPAGTYQGCTAIVNGYSDKTVTWTTTGGTLIGTNPGMLNEPNTISLYSATAGGPFTVTATANADHSLTATGVVTYVASPTPITNHPRFLVTQATLAAEQAKAVSGNLPYTSGVKGIASNYYTSYSAYGTYSTWSGSACTGGTWPTSDQSSNFTENGMWYMAQVALLDNSSTTRNQYGCAGRDVLIATLGWVLDGEIDLSSGNRWSGGSIGWSLSADWLMGGGYLSDSDIAVVRAFFAKLAFAQINDTSNGTLAVIGSYNSATQFQESSENSISGMRAMNNNYVHSRILIFAAAGLTFNDTTADDPAPFTISVNAGGTGWNVGDAFQIVQGGSIGTGKVATVSGSTVTAVYLYGQSAASSGSTATTTAISPATGTSLTVNVIGNTCSATRYQVCPDGTAGSLHAYFGGAGNAGYDSGGMLYLDWGMMEDPNVVQQAYNAAFSNLPSQPQCNTLWHVSIPCLGLDRGGESPEGFDYGGSIIRLRLALNAIYTAGYLDPLLYGPQMSMFSMPYWDLRLTSDLTQQIGLTGLQSESSRWTFLTDGDTDYAYNYPSNLSESGMLLANSFTGRTDNNNAIQWLLFNTAFGMISGSVGSCGSYCGINAELSDDYASGIALDTFLGTNITNPGTSAPTDPRPSLPTDWFDAGNNHIVTRDGGWTTGANTIFDYFCTNTQIDHEHQYCGRFDIYSNGEFITKGRMGFNDYDTWASYAPYQNVTAVVNSVGSGIPPTQYPWGPTTSVGGQFWHGYQAGLVYLNYSELPAYAAMSASDTNAYNGGWSGFGSYDDVSGASTERLYLRGAAQVITYDRAAVGHAASTQAMYLNTTGAVTISSGTAHWNTRSAAQTAYFTPLLPASLTMAATGLFNIITVVAPDLNLQAGTTEQMTCTSHYQDGSSQNCLTFPDQTLGLLPQWSASGNCTISSGGLITGGSVGACSIFVSYTFSGFVGVGLNINIVSGSSGGGPVTASTNNTQGQDWELSQYIKVTPSGTPTSSNFLGALQWGASGFTPATATLVQSSAGQGFDCALMGTSLGCFQRTLSTFTSTTFPALDGDTVYVSDLAPNTTYAVSGGGVTSETTDTAGVLTFNDSLSGDVTIGSSSPSPGGVTISGSVTMSGNVVIQ